MSLDLVERQLQAYNRQDLDGHCACFADDVVVANVGEAPNLTGIADYRARYEKLFAEFPKNHAELVSRVSIGDKIVDHERVRRSPEGAPFEVLAIYSFREGKIARVDFVR
jgi:hypothetical protein